MPEQIVIDEIHAKRDYPDNTLAVFDRDMKRLRNLREQYEVDGMNTVEHNEVEELLEKYSIDMLKWTRETMFL